MAEPPVLVCMDAETTGLGANEDFVQIAAVMHREGDETLSTLSSLALPEVSVSEGARETHGYSWDRLVSLGAKPSADVVMEFVADVMGFVGEATYVIAGHNIDYDIKVLSKHAILAAFIKGAGGTICTRQLAHRVSPMLPNHQLLTVFADWCGEGHHLHPHDALSDAWCVFKMVRKRVALKPYDGYLGLAQASGVPCVLGVMPFGKHKGTAFADLPESYLLWLAGNQNMDGDVRHSATVEIEERRRSSTSLVDIDDIPF